MHKPSESFPLILKVFVARFFRLRGGNVGLIFALCLPAMLGMVGGAIDLGFANANRASLQDAADAAALEGANAAGAYIAANGTGSSQVSQAVQIGNATAQTFFNADVRSMSIQGAPTLTAATTVQSGAPTTTVTVSEQYKPFLLSMVGLNAITIGVTSTTTMSTPNAYYQIIFVVDVSGSMGIGGDSATINTLSTKGAFMCAFACHDPNNLENGTATNYCDSNPSDQWCRIYGPTYCPYGTGACPTVYSKTMTDKRGLAKLYGYNLKIDYVNSAIGSFMSQLTTYNAKYPGRYTVGINTFGEGFNVLLPPTTNMSTAASAAGTIDIEAVQPVATTNWGHTRTSLGLASTLSSLTNVGDGSSPTKMRTYVIFMTDSVQDIEGSVYSGRQTNLNYSSDCDNLKNAGVSIFTIWAPYYAIPNDNQYNTLVAPLSSQMPATMQSCASMSSQYFQANDGPSISSAVNTTFNTIINNTSLRLTH